MSVKSNLLPVTAAVLAGGRSLRMGVDKTLLEVDGVPMLRRVTAAMGSVCEDVMVVTTRPEAAAAAGLPDEVAVIADEVGYQGPLGGITTALAQASQPWIMAVAADMPWLNPEVVRILWRFTEGMDIVVPRGERGLEPLLALYRVDAVEPIARAALESGERRPLAMYGDLCVREVSSEEIRRADPELRSLVNINTIQDLAQARGMPLERSVTVYMNGVEIVTVQASPRDLEDFAIGHLFSEGLLFERGEVQGVEIDARRGMVFVTTSEELPDGFQQRKRYVTSGCGKGVTFTSAGFSKDVAPVESDIRVQAEEIHALMEQMARGADRYRETGGMHSCALGRDGDIVLIREDVGRHNALDKVLGRAWLDGEPLDRAILLTSGRIFSETVVKAARCGVGIIVSRTAVTDLAAEMATELGVCLLGYVREGASTVYTHPWRVQEPQQEHGSAS